uniref:Uncharacterized protein n=2 Tax=Physcomitrium patens TaxID=3218 RepID=A0A7I4BPJ4_PHYPA
MFLISLKRFFWMRVRLTPSGFLIVGSFLQAMKASRSIELHQILCSNEVKILWLRSCLSFHFDLSATLSFRHLTPKLNNGQGHRKVRQLRLCSRYLRQGEWRQVRQL